MKKRECRSDGKRSKEREGRQTSDVNMLPIMKLRSEGCLCVTMYVTHKKSFTCKTHACRTSAPRNTISTVNHV